MNNFLVNQVKLDIDSSLRKRVFGIVLLDLDLPWRIVYHR